MPQSLDSLPEVLHHALDERARDSPERTFLLYDGRWWTYGEIQRHSLLIADGLRRLGIRQGDHVLVMMPSSEAYIAIWFAISRLGAVEVPINSAYRGEVLRHILETAMPKVALVDPEHRGVFDAVGEGLLPPGCVMDPWSIGLSGGESDTETLAPSDFPANIRPADTAAVIFTSGTTGLSKGVVVSHRHQISFGANFADIVQFRSDDISYNFLPFFHVAAKFETIGSLLAGGRMVLRPVFSLSRFWQDVRDGRATVCVAVGGLCHMLHGISERPEDAVNTLRLIYAVPVPWEFKREFERRFAIELVEAYGSTEANLPLYTRLGEETPEGSCGRASENFDVSIRDESGQELSRGEPGEICVRPRHEHTMMTGYLGLPDATVNAMRGGWFHSGDRATMNADGFVFFLDRNKDAIRRRGENISSFEVERLINAHPCVAEVAVVPVKGDLSEDEVKAVVVVRQGCELTHETLLDFCTATMPYFMVPRFIEFKATLPRTETMKVKKAELRSEGINAQTWDCVGAGFKVTRRGLERPKDRTAPVSGSGRA